MTTTQNGTGTKPAATKETKTNVVLSAANPKQPKVETEPKKETEEQHPLEDRIFKIQMLGDLIERREKFQETIKKLNSFKVSTDGTRDKLTITDGKGNEFFTTNSACIAEVVTSLKTSLQNKLVETEAQILL